MSSELQRVAQELLDALNQIEHIVPYLHDRARKYREGAAWIGSLSSNENARMAAMQLDEAARRCEEAAHFLAQARQPGVQWASRMVSGTRTPEPSAGTTGERPKATGADTSPSGKPSTPKLSEDEVRRIFERLPARKPGDKTRGVWRDDDGNEHDLVSGRHEDDFDAAQRHAERLGLVRRPHGITTAADLELKFAMRMRREGIRHAEIILNNRPCEGPLSCDELLGRFLPDGASLTVYGPDNFKRTYPKKPQQD